MPDPFEELRQPAVPLAPRTEFARDLRRRIVAALDSEPPEAPVTQSLEVREYTPARLHAITAYIALSDPARAIEWYQDVFGAQLLGEPIVMPDGTIGHAELRIGDSVFMLAGEFPDEQHLSPDTLGGSTVGLMVYVPDAEATYAKAVEHGATALRPLAENYGSLQGTLRDPFGHRWFVATALAADDVPVEDVSGRRFGDIGYVVFQSPDGARAARFFGGLFGWDLHDGYQPGAFHIASITPPSGIDTGYERSEARIYFRVDDIEAATARVRELGGQVLKVDDYDSGGNAECVDDQGFRFDLFRPKPGY
jgi:uncharacterized glyoxalase superfamily protein PhnB